MQRTCRESGEVFEIAPEDLAYYENISPVFNGKKYSLPPPTLAPRARFRRRLAFRNERALYHRECSLSGRQIISIFSPDSPYKVYDQDAWWSDKWDAFDYGRDFDFSRTFAEQFAELNLTVPHMSLYTRDVENSYYTNYAVGLKNCYLLYGVVESEDCTYGRTVLMCRDVVDGLSLIRCELCYEGVASDGCYSCAYFTNCRDCAECFFVEDCHSCKNCVLCFGLHRKEYCIENRFVGKEKYQEYLRELFPLTRKTIGSCLQNLEQLKKELPRRQSHIFASENCVGDAIFNSKNSHFCFHISDCEDSKYLYVTTKGVCSYDGSYAAPHGPEYSYEFCSCTGSNHSVGIFLCWLCHAAFYSMECQSCRNIFGCVGLRNQDYCIMNKPHSKSEYERKMSRIAEHMIETGEWGEFFPVSLSLFAYNETVAQEEFPLSREEVLERGWKWREREEKPTTQAKAVTDFPESIDRIQDQIVSETFQCQASGEPYRIIAQELKFYRKFGIPLPELCPNERHRQRLRRRPPLTLWTQRCTATGRDILSVVDPRESTNVLSHAAYQRLLSG